MGYLIRPDLVNRQGPMIERPVVDLYKSPVGKNETSIVLYGVEPGFFWDCEEFNRWKRTGRIEVEDDDTN